MKKFSPPQMKEVSFPTPHTPHPTPHTLHPTPHTPHPTEKAPAIDRPDRWSGI